MRHLQQRGPVQVTLERGMLRLRRGNPQAEGLYDPDTTNALRAFFQAERDDALGRWRDTENPDMVVYRTPEDDDGCGRCILLLDENTGDNHWEWERIATSGPGLRYFAAHPQPEPKPWEEAEHEEIWVITANGDTGPALATTSHRRGTGLAFQTANGTLLDATEITAGRRIWPEPRIGGTE